MESINNFNININDSEVYTKGENIPARYMRIA